MAFWRKQGTGALSITTTGKTTGGTCEMALMRIQYAGTDLTINAATTTGGTYGIYAQNNGTGALSITTTGTTTGTAEMALMRITIIHASTGDLTIVTGEFAR